MQRLRVPAGFLLLITFAWLAQPTPLSLAAGLPISILGMLLRGWAAGHLAKNRQLATSGPYARIRNPLYQGTLITAFGIVIAARHPGLAVIFAVVFLAVYLPSIELEEQHVNRFLPFAKWPHSAGHFSWALYRKNEEYKAAIGFAVAAAWLAWRCWPAVIRFRS
jgi:hypothetical protein